MLGCEPCVCKVARVGNWKSSRKGVEPGSTGSYRGSLFKLNKILNRTWSWIVPLVPSYETQVSDLAIAKAGLVSELEACKDRLLRAQQQQDLVEAVLGGGHGSSPLKVHQGSSNKGTGAEQTRLQPSLPLSHPDAHHVPNTNTQQGQSCAAQNTPRSEQRAEQRSEPPQQLPPLGPSQDVSLITCLQRLVASGSAPLEMPGLPHIPLLTTTQMAAAPRPRSSSDRWVTTCGSCTSPL